MTVSQVVARPSRWLALSALSLLLAFAASACANDSGDETYMQGDAPYLGVWWTGGGSHVVAQFTTEDGTPAVIAWDARSGETLPRRTGVRVVAVEQAAPRVWLVPSADGAEPADTAGDPLDAPPEDLLMWDLAGGEAPTDEAEARWKSWPGPGAYTAYLEIDVLKGALPARLLFQPSTGETEGSKAAVPEGVSTFEPVGWSPSGERFAVRAVGLDAPTVLVFSAATGQVEWTATVPATSRAGQAGSAAWGTGADEALYWFGPPLLRRTPGASGPLPYPPASSYMPAEDSALLGIVPSGALLWQQGGEDRGVWLIADPEATGGSSRAVTDGEVAAVAYDGTGMLAILENDPPALFVGRVEGERKRIWEAEE